MEKLIWQHIEDESDRIYTIAELRQHSEETEERFWAAAKCWKLCPDKKTLRCVDPIYEVDLSAIKTRAGLLHWILHLHGKAWMTTDILGEFITATRYLLEKRLNL